MLTQDKYGLILDLETTGLNSDQDEIIEIGLIEFKFNSTTKQTELISTYSQLREPKVEVSEEIQKITGITPHALKGMQIDWLYVQSFLNRADIVIAHHMEFDRSFLMRCQELDIEDIHWGCSSRHIDWTAKGFKSLALNYLAADHGFVNPFAHRALFDCATTYRLITPHFEELYLRSFERDVRVIARGAPFEKKDLLRARKYRWDQEQKVWLKIISESQLVQEREFLSSQIYSGDQLHLEEMV